MKKRFALFVTVSMGLIMSMTNAFAESDNIPKMKSQSIEHFSTLKQDNVEEELIVIHQDDVNALNSNEIEDRYGVKAFRAELKKVKPNLELSSINRYVSTYIEIFNMYKEMNPHLSNETIAERAKANMLNKIEFEIDDSDKHITDRSAKEPDGYEVIVNFINENLKPDYHATLETTKENIDILKKNMNNLPDKFKDMALLYIEDMEAGEKCEKINADKKLKTDTLSGSAEKGTISKGVSSMGRNIIPIILIGVLIVLILFRHVFMRARKK